MDFTEIRLSGKTRREHDLLGEMEIPAEYYFGVQTMRAVENFHISRVRLNFFPELIRALADVKQGAAMANRDLGLLDPAIADAIIRACEELRAGKLEEQFVVDMVQGGAGTSTNMNANEVIANRALELLGHEKGEYQFCHPNNHVNLSQSTNDAYPTAVRIALVRSIEKLVASLRELIAAFHAKGEEFSGIIKMGRTQLQDAVPMTLGQEFEAFAANLTEEINLPPRQPGSSIMPGKVNPVIPEVVNQVAFRVIGNDLTVTIASEAGQLELNVMEPIIVHCLFESIEMLINAMNTLREKCIAGITANEEVCRRMVFNSIGLVTALNPYLGYETSSMLAKEALKTGKGIYDLVLEHKLMSEEELHKVLQPENMVHPRKKIGE